MSSRVSSIFGTLLRSIEHRPRGDLSKLMRAHTNTAVATKSQHRFNSSFRRHGKAVEPQHLNQSPSPEDSKIKDTSGQTSDGEAPKSSDPNETLVSEILGPKTTGSFQGSHNQPSIDSNKFKTGSSESSIPGSNSFNSNHIPPDGNSTIGMSSPSAPNSSMDMVLYKTDIEGNFPGASLIHHFDSYNTVQQLMKGSYTEAQAITLMKAIRANLTRRLVGAQRALLSKSDVENETYLFRAACSELGNEVKNNRRVADEQMRRERTLLQHELDILSQSIGQEIAGMNDTVKGMVNDRSMSRREEHKALESAIQQLNYKISIMLTSDAKADIETIRWILIRRAVLGILFMAVISVTLIQVTSSARAERKQKDADEAKAQREEKEKRKATEVLAAAAAAAAAQAEERMFGDGGENGGVVGPSVASG